MPIYLSAYHAYVKAVISGSDIVGTLKEREKERTSSSEIEDCVQAVISGYA
jgi:hypothetical protein